MKTSNETFFFYRQRTREGTYCCGPAPEGGGGLSCPLPSWGWEGTSCSGPGRRHTDQTYGHGVGEPNQSPFFPVFCVHAVIFTSFKLLTSNKKYFEFKIYYLFFNLKFILCININN